MKNSAENGPAPVREDAQPLPPAGVSFRRIALISLGTVVVFSGAIGFFGFFDGIGWLHSLTLPPLVSAKGSIRLTSGPLTRGEVWTHPVDGRTPGSVGFINQRGEFVLKTDVNGSYVEGVYAGEHKVTLSIPQNLPRLGVGQPPSMVAEKYQSLRTTPLTIQVSRQAAENVYALVVEPNEQLAATAEGAEKAEGGASGGQQGGGADMAAMFALRKRLETMDTDRDRAYSRAELLEGGIDLGEKFSEVDADASGAVEESELSGLQKALEAATPPQP